MKLVPRPDIENKGPHSFILFFSSLKRKSLFFGSCCVFKMTGKIGRTREVQNWRVTCQTWLVCTPRGREGLLHCLWNWLRVLIGSFRGDFCKQFDPLFVCFPCSWKCGELFYSIKHAGKRCWMGDPFLGAGNGDTLRDAATASDFQSNLHQSELGRGPIPGCTKGNIPSPCSRLVGWS